MLRPVMQQPSTRKRSILLVLASVTFFAILAPSHFAYSQGEKILALIERLRDERWNGPQGSDAVETLVRIGSPAVGPLINALRANDANTKRNAVKALARIGDPRAVVPLVGVLGNALRNDDADTRNLLVHGFESFGRPGVLGLIQAMKNDPDPYARAGVASALVDLKEPEIIDALFAALDDSTPLVRKNAAWTLGNKGEVRAVRRLVAALEDPDVEVRKYAARALGHIGEISAIPMLAKALAAERDADTIVWIGQSFWGFGAAGADTLFGFIASTDIGVRYWSSHALQRLWQRGEIEQGRFAAVMREVLDRQDVPTVAGAYEYFIAEGDPASESLLVAGLRQHGNKRMAEVFLNSGNDALATAARTYASKAGYSIISQHWNYGAPRWGSKK